MLKLIEIAAEMIKSGKGDDEIRKALFNVKGARVHQINKVMELVKG